MPSHKALPFFRGITPKQDHALARAPAKDRATMARGYREQHNGRNKARNNFLRLGRRGVRRGGRNGGIGNISTFGNVSRMEPGGPRKGTQKNVAFGENWGQTPASNNNIAPRGFGYYDAFEHDPYSVATHMSIGPATPVVGTTIVSADLITIPPANIDNPHDPGDQPEAGAKLLIVFPALGNTQAVLYWCDGTSAGGAIKTHSFISPQLKEDQPDNAIATRCSLRIRNWSQQVAVGGIVRILRMTTGVALAGPSGGAGGPAVTTNLQLCHLQDAIRVHKRTRTYGGEELLQTCQKNCTVVDQSKACWFATWEQSVPASQLPWTAHAHWDQDLMIEPFTAGLHDPAYTPIAVLFEPFQASLAGVGNVYECSVRSQFLAHYAQGTMLANMAISSPTAPEALTKARDHEESKGSVLETQPSKISQAGNWAWNHKADIGNAAQYAMSAARMGRRAYQGYQAIGGGAAGLAMLGI